MTRWTKSVCCSSSLCSCNCQWHMLAFIYILFWHSREGNSFNLLHNGEEQTQGQTNQEACYCLNHSEFSLFTIISHLILAQETL